MRRRFFGAMSLAAGLMLIHGTACAGQTEWVRIGDKTAGSGLETETIEVGRGAGLFERVRLDAASAEVFIQEVRVYFADGDMQRLASQLRVARDGQTEAFELEGGLRHIARIELTYKAPSARPSRPGQISVWAESASAHLKDDPSRADGFDPEWELLGKEIVGNRVSHNVIPIGQHEGRFEALRLRVLRSDVAFHDIRVIYLNGDSDTLAVRKLVRAGDASPPLTLKGEAQYIREVELVQEANPDMKGQAVVQVWARRSNH